MAEQVLVEWRRDWVCIRDGMAQPRRQGDEDIMSRPRAQQLAAAGLVRIVGNAKRTLADRQITEEVAEQVAEQVADASRAEPVADRSGPCTAPAAPAGDEPATDSAEDDGPSEPMECS